MSSRDFQTIVDTIFAHDAFKDLDKKALVERYDTTGAIDEVNSTLGSVSGQEPQTGNVISRIPPQGIIINSPGTYTFSDDLTWNPGSVTSAAITIDADNVTLDLCNHKLAATVQDSGQHITGIYIKNASAVTIQNGTLVDMCFYGIRAEEVTDLTIQNLTVSGLNFKNLDIRSLCPAGIHVNQALGVKIADCTVQYMYVTADSSAGIQLLNTVSGTVSCCRISNLVNYDGSVQGYSYVGAVNITTSNCTAEEFQSHFGGNIRTFGHTVLGFCPIFCLDLKYENCSATGMTGCSDDCHGMSVFLNAMVTVDNFTANFVTDGVTPSNTGAKATGLEVYGAYVSISNCSVENIKAIHPQDKQSTGFSAWGVAISFTDCKAGHVIVCDQNGHENPDLGYGTGFGWAPDPRVMFRNVGAYFARYEGCEAHNCQVGFDTWYHVDSTWTDVNCMDCGIGILVQPGESRTLSGNPASECNPPITAVIKNIARGNTYPGS
jgi:hypothetical protein